MRALVVGASGQIGGWIAHWLQSEGHEVDGTYATVPFPGLIALDAADHAAAARLIRRVRPGVVFYPAGFTWVDGCERDPARARAFNLDQPLFLAREARDLGAQFVYLSTDYVFDGTTGPDPETTTPHPLSAYGKAKRDAEIAIEEELGDGALIVRTCWVFGPERQGKNFAYQVVKALRAGKPVVCPSDQTSTPSYGPDVARAIVALVERGESGVIHVAGPETMNRPDFARRIAQAFGLDPSGILGRPTSELGQAAPRPLNGGLRTPRLDALLPGFMRPLDSALEDFRERSKPSETWADPFALE
jgi:dTDP-4-dehydrorhamnose reductase